MNTSLNPQSLRDRARRRADSLTRAGKAYLVFDEARALAGIRALGFEAPGPITLTEYGVMDGRGDRCIVFSTWERCPCSGQSAFDHAIVTIKLSSIPGTSRLRQREVVTDAFIDVFRQHREDDERAAAAEARQPKLGWDWD